MHSLRPGKIRLNVVFRTKCPVLVLYFLNSSIAWYYLNKKPPKLGQQQRKQFPEASATRNTRQHNMTSSDDGVFDDKHSERSVDDSYRSQQKTADSYRSERSLNVLKNSGNSKLLSYGGEPSVYKESVSTILNYSGNSRSPGPLTRQDFKLDDDIEFFGDENSSGNVLFESREVKREQHVHQKIQSVQQIRTVEKSPVVSVAVNIPND